MSRIIATGAYLPNEAITNEALIARYQLDSSDDWIVQRSGIRQRFFAGEESLGSLAIKAAQDLLATVDDDIRTQIRHIIVATMSARTETPSIACQVQAGIEASNAWAFDVNGACSGFIMALDIVNALSQTQATGYTLVIGAEKMSQIIDFSDRSTAVLFGDGAGAVLIEHDGQPLLGYKGELHSVKDERNSIVVQATAKSDPVMAMEGREVFNFVKRTVIRSLGEFIANHVADYDYLIPHQANQRLMDLMSMQLGIDKQKIASNIAQTANTSAASIPLLLNQLVETSKILLSGEQAVVLTGFGGGLSWGHIYLHL
ncbi:beta-ketoacyl-ACP synthase 3 [Aerococcaceae bacterium NML210727]|nr:beta-ketoacyl-ACP synthase 3 [Aerococcaceae bacterium NML210727]MCW6655331.1 beta-ketoacyl-ACP synthase 3 [Aerococcaceae bacterium NML201296]